MRQTHILSLKICRTEPFGVTTALALGLPNALSGLEWHRFLTLKRMDFMIRPLDSRLQCDTLERISDTADSQLSSLSKAEGSVKRG